MIAQPRCLQRALLRKLKKKGFGRSDAPLAAILFDGHNLAEHRIVQDLAVARGVLAA
ncbi:hypothetical protein [Erythrobacter sp. SD-21]|uniref:hypothetical protein n=1 Tax=Erythrobacter sp. SD-21 TaxID=161528 RepID=UPI000153F7CF|nr:hypothetical protein [Erythrobacter sp. SD-21]EDL48069.1 hypothetical protein ED21_29521 [Erythrobacter sp. SD-21]